MPRSVLLSAARTPIGSFNGALASVPAPQLGAVAVKDALDGCERILRDEFKDYAESALYMIGVIAEAKAPPIIVTSPTPAPQAQAESHEA